MSECTEIRVNRVTRPAHRQTPGPPGHTNHQSVAERIGQGPRRRQTVEALPGQGGEIQNAERGEVDAHRAKVQVFDVHGAHGAKQQRGRQHHEDEVGQVFHRAGANPFLAARHKADGNEKHHGNQEAMTGEFKTARQKEKEQGREQQSQRSNAINLIAASAL